MSKFVTVEELVTELVKAEPDEYEFIGTIDGTHGGRWVLTVKDKAAVWPDGTAVYARRGTPLKIGEQLGEQLGEQEPTLNQNTSTMWEMLNLTEEWQARLEAAVLAEREACAQICDENVKFWKSCPDRRAAEGSRICGEEIRARGEE